jgi:hypothetical protein
MFFQKGRSAGGKRIFADSPKQIADRRRAAVAAEQARAQAAAEAERIRDAALEALVEQYGNGSQDIIARECPEQKTEQQRRNCAGRFAN